LEKHKEKESGKSGKKMTGKKPNSLLKSKLEQHKPNSPFLWPMISGETEQNKEGTQC